jgi:thymidylate synthase (FAD)
MKTKLISITQPSIEGAKTAEELISYCARVSNPSNQMNSETAPKLLKFLIKHRHWSPFEMASMCVEIKTSRAIAAQILRHRSFSFQEFSQRYSKATALEPIQLRRQSDKNRQSSTDEFEPFYDDGAEMISLKDEIEEYLEFGQQLYDRLIEAGTAKECARGVLPLTTETTMYMTGTIRSWIHYFDIRCEEHVQLEHREIAEEIRDNIFTPNFPCVAEALGYANNE